MNNSIIVLFRSVLSKLSTNTQEMLFPEPERRNLISTNDRENKRMRQCF